MEVAREVLVVAAWTEHETAHAEYAALKAELRAAGVGRRAVARRGRVIAARRRLARAWMALHELGEVELRPYPPRPARRA